MPIFNTRAFVSVAARGALDFEQELNPSAAITEKAQAASWTKVIRDSEDVVGNMGIKIKPAGGVRELRSGLFAYCSPLR
jgi:hypothetical protein